MAEIGLSSAALRMLADDPQPWFPNCAPLDHDFRELVREMADDLDRPERMARNGWIAIPTLPE